MNPPLLDLISARHSRRAFLDREIPRGDVEAVLRAAASAPSAKNTQPWEVLVVRGAPLRALVERLCAGFDSKTREAPDFAYYPDPMPPFFEERALGTAAAIFAHKGIAPGDIAAKLAHSRENYRLFGAPLALFFLLPAGAARGTFLDLGFYMQNVMLGFESIGAASCPMASILSLTPTIRASLSIPADRWLCCALAVGYPDPGARANSFEPARLSLDRFTRWIE